MSDADFDFDILFAEYISTCGKGGQSLPDECEYEEEGA